jgi:hypothetical protein
MNWRISQIRLHNFFCIDPGWIGVQFGNKPFVFPCLIKATFSKSENIEPHCRKKSREPMSILLAFVSKAFSREMFFRKVFYSFQKLI